MYYFLLMRPLFYGSTHSRTNRSIVLVQIIRLCREDSDRTADNEVEGIL